MRKNWTLLACFMVGLLIGGYIGKKRGIPFVRKVGRYSIGIYIGESPFNLADPDGISNPVLTARDVTDHMASFVADPFMVCKNDHWYMFFEVMNEQTKQGDIGLAESNNGLTWVYKQIVLDEPFHLSYPYVFEWNDDFYMIPESHESYYVRLYKAEDFPTKWSFVKNLFSGNYSDPSILYHNERWWMFASDRQDVLRLFYADELTGTWTEHCKSPLIVGNANIARPGGRVLSFNNQIFRFAQDCDPTYGNQVRAFEVIKLTTDSYREKEVSENPIIEASGRGWNAEKMHHIDLHKLKEKKWIACVDGFGKSWVFGLKY